MQTTWLSIIPPLLVLISAFISRRLNLSLILGIACAALIATSASLGQAGSLMFTRVHDQVTDIENLQTYAFLILISVLIVLISTTGGVIAFGRAITSRLKSAKMVQTSSLLLSMCLFIDDYLSNLTVGYVIRPLTDEYKIPRAKLAFLVHSLSGPLVILAPISSWVAYITGQLDQAGVTPLPTETTTIIAEPFFIYLQTLPYVFYSFAIIASAWFIVRAGISYGAMTRHETLAATTGNLFGGKKPLQESLTPESTDHGTLADFLLPLTTLIGSTIIGILYAGSFHLLGGTNSLIQALKSNTQTPLILLASVLFTLTITILRALLKRQLSLANLARIAKDGFLLMYPAVVMVVLASTLGALLREDLHTGVYLAQTLLGSMSVVFLPVCFFGMATIMALVTGSSWGTIALLVPIGIQMLMSVTGVATPVTPEALPLLFPLLGAIFSGAVCGDHISPISETTIMAATSSGCYPIDHAQTQFPYAVPAIIGAATAFILSGYLASYGTLLACVLPLGVSLVVSLGGLFALRRSKSAK